MWQNALGSPIIRKGPYLLVYTHPVRMALSLSLSTVSHVSERAQPHRRILSREQRAKEGVYTWRSPGGLRWALPTLALVLLFRPGWLGCWPAGLHQFYPEGCPVGQDPFRRAPGLPAVGIFSRNFLHLGQAQEHTLQGQRFFQLQGEFHALR